MRVLFDISTLGLGYSNPICRAGVYRTVETLAKGLAQVPTLDLMFCAGASFELLRQSIAYLQTQPDLAGIPLCHNRLGKWFSEVGDRPLSASLQVLNQQVEKTTGGEQFYWKLIRRPVFQAYCAAVNRNPLDSKSLRQANIFHSPFYALPAQAKQFPYLQCFLTVHDLIPILYSHLFESNDDVVLKSILQSLDPHHWVICVSESTKNDLCNYRSDLDPDRIFVISWGASDLFSPCTNPQKIQVIKAKYQIPDRPYFLSLSTLEPRKNISHLIRAFSQFIEQEKNEEILLVLVGQKGWNYQDILQSAAANHLKDRVIFTGYVANSDLSALYSGALAFLYPSLYEGFGLPPLEAMQCGVPVVTSNTSSLPEVVGSAGLTLPPTDLDVWCQALLNLSQDPDLRRQLSQQSLTQAQKFSWERCIQQTQVAYTTAIQSSGK